MKTRYLIVALVLASSAAWADDAKKKEKAPPTAGAPAEPPVPPDKPPTSASAEIKVGAGVEKREIVGEATTFTAGTTVWVWSRIVNGEGKVKHIWKRDGKAVWTATLAVGSKRWSTQSRRAIPKAGSWEVEVQTEAGASLGTASFTVN